MNTRTEQERTVQKSPKGTERGQTNPLSPEDPKRRLPESHQDSWIPRLRKRCFVGRDGGLVEIPVWQVRLKFQKREAWFNLQTSNRNAAAAHARDIYRCLVSNGWDACLLKYKPPTESKQNLSVDEFVNLYREALHRIEYPPQKRTAERYIKDFLQFCRTLRVSRLSDVTPDAVNKFKAKYLNQARKENRKETSLQISCNALMRNASGLFSQQMLEEYRNGGLVLLNPFAGRKLKRIGIQPYSPLNRDVLDTIWADAAKLRDGDPEAPEPRSRRRGEPAKRWTEPNWAEPHPEAYTLLLVELGLGLRRNEADKAQWDWFRTDSNGRHYLEVKATPYFTPKSRHKRTIPVEQLLFEAIHASRRDATPFIVPGRVPKTYARGKEPKNIVYRCDQHHRTLACWLRDHGVKDEKPCHLMRKEFGSYVATSFGLFHAQHMLGHSSPKVTSDYYAGLTQLLELRHAKITVLENETHPSSRQAGP